MLVTRKLRCGRGSKGECRRYRRPLQFADQRSGFGVKKHREFAMASGEMSTEGTSTS